MITLPELKALAKAHNLHCTYLNKEEIIKELLNKQIVTTVDLCKPKMKTKKTEANKTEVDVNKYERLKGIRTNPRTVEVRNQETDEVTVYPSTYKANRAIKIENVTNGKIKRGLYEFKIVT